MFSKKITLSFLTACFIALFSFGSGFASPVLIKLELETEEDFQKAQSLQVIPYQRFGAQFLSEINSERLEELRASELEYEVVDADPWSENYYIVSSLDPVKKEPISRYGKTILHEEGWSLLRINQEKALELQKMGFSVTQIPRKPIPLKYSPPIQLNKQVFEYSADLDSLVDMISQDSLWTYVKRLQDFLSRFTWADSIVPAREWIYDKFVEFGCDSVYFDELTFYDPYFESAWTTQYNVVATVVGTVNPDKVIVVGGHYDSIVWDPMYLAYTQAPGADDNASGTVAAMEQARIIAQNRLPCTVVFIAFAGEELGLHGAWHYADRAFAEKEDILLMMNYDMIGELANQSTVRLFRDPGSVPYAEIFKEMAFQYNTPALSVEFYGTSAGSDHFPFWQNGYNALFAIEQVFSGQYHAPSDSITYMNFDYMEKIVRAGFATLVTLAEHPGLIKGLDYVDAGDGERLYINWLPSNENDLVNYNLYWGRRSSVYDSLRTVPTTYTSDTLYNLVSDSTYYITVTAYNDKGKESLVKTEIVAAPRLIPSAPQEFVAQPGFKKIILGWSPNKEADLDYYNIYRSTSSEGDFDLLTSGLENTTYEDSAIGSGMWYYYYMTAVDTTELESPGSDIDSSQAVTLDQGILVIDETRDGNGKPGNPSDAQQDSFYAEIFEGFNVHFHDYSYSSDRPTLEIIGPYSTVVWMDEDISYHYLGEEENYSTISEYLELGGNFMWCNWDGLESMGGLPRTYEEGSFVYDYLHIRWADLNDDYDFVGAKASDSPEYPDVEIDTTKLKDIWEGKLEKIVKLDYHGGADPIYLYDSFGDSIAFEDSICGIKYQGPTYRMIFLGFPLFYLKKDDAQALIQAAMSDLGEPTTSIEEKGVVVVNVNSFVLSQNYPNPFNSRTMIHFKVNGSRSTENGPIHTTVSVFNILGQKVKTLLNEEKLPGNYTVIWDGKDDKGKDVASGIYFYKLKVGDFHQSKKMLLLK